MDTSGDAKQAQPMIKYAATYGLILGLAMILTATIDYVFKLYGESAMLSLLNYVVIIGGIVFFTIMYRDKALGGYISYGQAVGFGVVLMIFAGFISGIFSCLLGIIDPSYIAKQMEAAADMLFQAGYDEYMIEKSMAVSRILNNPIVMLLSAIFAGALMGTVISLITSIFIKREKSIF